MRKPLRKLVATCLIFGLTLPATAENSVVSVGGKNLNLPVPDRFVVIQPTSPLFVDKEQWTTPSNRLLALYAPSGENKDIKPTNQIAIQTFRKTERANVSVEEFQSIRSQFRGSYQALIVTATRDANKHQPPRKDSVAALANSVKVGETQVLEVFNENSDSSISMLMLVKYMREIEGKTIEMPTIFSNTVFLLRGKICFLYVYSAFDAPDAIDRVKAQTLEWLAAANKSNP